MSDLNLPGYDRWLDSPFEKGMDRRAVDEDEEEEVVEDESADEDLWEDYPVVSNYPPGVTDNDPHFDLPSVGDGEEGDHDRIPIPCSKCGEPTTFDPIYGDLCYRCCRADNE